MFKSICLTVAIIVVSAPNLMADQEDDFESAIGLWLEGNDDRSLPAISALANDGYVNAQILLGQIEQRSFTSEFVSGLTRKERIALFRYPGGLSGKSWLVPSSEVSELASALLNARRVESKLSSILALYDLGESRIADSTLISWMSFGMEELFELATTQKLPSQLKPVITMHILYNWSAGFYDLGYVLQLIPKLMEFDNFGKDLSAEEVRRGRYLTSTLLIHGFPDSDHRSNIMNGWIFEDGELRELSDPLYQDWIMESPELEVLRQICERACPEDVTNCTMVAYAGVPIHSVAWQGSPTETLISQDRYFQSERAIIDMITAWNIGFPRGATTPESSSCLAELIEPVRARND